MLKAIETRYKGYRFRSRLEARWAVFFDTLSVPWEYEAQGYDLGSAGPYLPDFWMPAAQAWIEIKPDTPSLVELDKARQLARGRTDGLVLLAAGTPGQEHIWVITDRDLIGPDLTDTQPVWCDLLRLCGKICHTVCPRTRTGYLAARAARFEHGEHGR